jgi:CRISPR-associated protein Cmr3
MQTIEIQALDTLFFRDGKPFSMGEDTWANSMFPPLPSVIYGALDTAFLMQQKDLNLTQARQFSLNSLLLRKDNDFIFPFPNDLVVYENKKDKKISTHKLLLVNKETVKGFVSNYTLDYLLQTPKADKVKDVANSYLSLPYFKAYLEGSLKSQEGKIYEEIELIHEPKIGIGRDNETNITEEGKIYRVGMKRAIDIKLAISTDSLKLVDNKSFLRLGAENKQASYEIDNYTNDFEKLKNITIKSNQFKVYLSTPAIFKDDYKPIAFHNCKLLACAIGKSIAVGGFDIDKKEPKPMYKAVPAGSVYYFEAADKETAQKIANEVNNSGLGTAISEVGDFAKQGFGIAYIGNI